VSADLQFESPQLHQGVRASRRDFLVRRIARHFRGLRRQWAVCQVIPPSVRLICGSSRQKSLAANFRFQGCCFATCPPPELLFATGSTCEGTGRGSNANIGQALPKKPRCERRSFLRKPPSERRSFLRSCWRLEPERPPLVRPRHGKINETFEAETAWQASFDRGLDDVGGEENKRQGHPDRTVCLAFSIPV
jgi:hypothetical protein